MLLSLLERWGRRRLRSLGIGSRTIETPLGRLHVYEGLGSGTLPPIVALHGIGATALPYGAIFRRLMPYVQRVAALELPGHGFSDPLTTELTPETLLRTTREALARLIDRPSILCGNSLGGAVVLDFAKHHPEKVAGLVLLSPAGARMNAEEMESVRQVFEIKSRRDAVRFLGRLYHRTPRYAPLIAGEVRKVLSRKHVRSLFANVRADDCAMPDELAQLHQPVLLIWGKSERVLPSSGLEYFRAHLPPHARIEEPENMGHCAHLEHPSAIAQRILDFAREVAGRGPNAPISAAIDQLPTSSASQDPI